MAANAMIIPSAPPISSSSIDGHETERTLQNHQQFCSQDAMIGMKGIHSRVPQLTTFNYSLTKDGAELAAIAGS